MPKPLKIKLSVPKPCSQDWDKMTPDEKGKFCAQCSKTVIDFSGYSDTELITYFTRVKSKVCGIYNASQLNRMLISNTPSTTPILHRVLFGTALAAGLAGCNQNQGKANSLSNQGQAQTQKKMGSFTHIAPANNALTESNKPTISGLVIDSNTEHPLEGIIMTLSFGGKEFEDHTYTDSNGYFSFNVPSKFIGKTLKLRVHDSHYNEKIHVFENVQLPVEIIFGLVAAHPPTYTRLMGDTCCIEPIKK